MGQQLVSHQDVLDRLVAIYKGKIPSGLTQPIIDKYIAGSTSLVLREMKIDTLPTSESLEREAADKVCLGLTLYEIRKDYFGLDGATMSALERQLARELEVLGETAEQSGTGDITIRVVGGRDQ